MTSGKWYSNIQRNYLGCFYPALSIVGLLLVLWALSQILNIEKPRFPVRDLHVFPNYPDKIDLADSILITEAGLKWLLLTYFFWLVALISIGFCFVQLRRAVADNSRALTNVVYTIFFTSILLVLGVLLYFVMVRDTPLMSFEFLLRNLSQVGQGFVNLTTYSTGLAHVTIITIIVTISLVLIPQLHDDDEVKQIQAITHLMYVAAGFLLVWIAQATEMYRFAATLLIPEHREQVLKLAPTISLMAGAFASLLLAATYLSSYFYLQARHHGERLGKGKTLANEIKDKQSPKHFLLAHWPKITAVLMPVLPGVMGSVFNLLAQPM